MKPKTPNAKNPAFEPPVELPAVSPEDYDASIASGRGSAHAPDKQNGTGGFSPQLAGHGKAGKSHTSSFGQDPPNYTLPGYPSGKETAKTNIAPEDDKNAEK